MECCNCEEGVGDRTSEEDGWVSTAEFKAEPRSEDLVAIVDAMQELDRQRATLQRLVRLLALVCSVCAASRGAAQDARGSEVPTLRVTSNLALLDVYSTDLASLSRAEKDDLSCGSTAT